jgi:hypothetical protein
MWLLYRKEGHRKICPRHVEAFKLIPPHMNKRADPQTKGHNSYARESIQTFDKYSHNGKTC